MHDITHVLLRPPGSSAGAAQGTPASSPLTATEKPPLRLAQSSWNPSGLGPFCLFKVPFPRLLRPPCARAGVDRAPGAAGGTGLSSEDVQTRALGEESS